MICTFDDDPMDELERAARLWPFLGNESGNAYTVTSAQALLAAGVIGGEGKHSVGVDQARRVLEILGYTEADRPPFWSNDVDQIEVKTSGLSPEIIIWTYV